MMKISTFIVTLCSAIQFLGAANLYLPEMELQALPHGVRVELSFDHISLEQWQEMLETPDLFAKFGYGIGGAPGDPALPMTNQLIPILSAGTIQIKVSQHQTRPLSNVLIKSVSVGHLDSDPVRSTPSLYQRVSRPGEQEAMLTTGEPVSMRGQQFLPLRVLPVQYDRATGLVQVPTYLEVELTGVELPEELEVPAYPGLRSITTPEDGFPRRGHYLIVSPPLFEPYLIYFTAWKERMGYRVTVVSTDETGQSRDDIKAYIQTAWDTWEHRPDYLLLIGDSDQGMPGWYIQNDFGDNLIGDHPYGLLEGDDSFPELMIGRLSVDTISELVSFTSKIIRYESMPPMEQPAWFQRALMISTNIGAASARATKEWIADEMLSYGYSEVHTAYAPEINTRTAIANPINQGVGFVNYRGFGFYTGWAGPDFTSDDIEGLISNGAKTPIITSVVCGGGNFAANEDPCFGEVWTRAGTAGVPRGAVAFFGPSELYTHTQFNNVIDLGIYAALLQEGEHTLGNALWAGKYELWRNYHQNTYFPFNQTAEFYHHIYNLLGDPGMQMWSATPEILTVTHSDTLSRSQNTVEVLVLDPSGNPVNDAYVALFNEENAIGNYTDAAGMVTLPFAPGETLEIDLTVTGINLYPYQSTIPIQETSQGLTLESWIEDPEIELVAGSSQSMVLEFFNHGEAMSDVVFSFSSTAQGVSVTSEILLPSIAANSSLDPMEVEIIAEADLLHGTTSRIQVDVVGAQESWNWQKLVVVQAPDVNLHDFLLLSGVVTPGDSAQFMVELINLGGAFSGPLTLTPLAHDLLRFSSDPLICPSIEIDGLAVTDNVLDVVFDEQIFPGEQLTVAFECASSSRIDTLFAEVTIGEVIRFGPSQADEYGYRMFDEFDLSYSQAQSYDWIAINPGLGIGSTIGLVDLFEEADASTVIPLPFPVTYYGHVYNEITVCTNGWAALGSHDVVNFHNRIIPSAIGPPAMLAPFWDDLITGSGHINQLTTADEGQFVLEWSNVSHLEFQNRLSFQVVIFNTDSYPTETGDNDIKFQYRHFDNTDILANFATIGIESPDSRDGLLASYNNIDDPSVAYLRDRTAILFSTERGTRYQNASIAVNTNSVSFQQNPWSTGQDSVVFTNTGETPVAYAVTAVATTQRQPQVVQPLAITGVTKQTPDAWPSVSVFREGSDAFGHSWSKSTEADGPTYVWYDIESPGNLLEWQGDPDDSSIGPMPLGFEFPFYDEIYSEVFIGSNGTLSFESPFSPWLNMTLPNLMSPPAMIAPWWDDLNNDQPPQGSIYFWSNGNDQCIITWKDFPKWGTSQFYTFQVVLTKIGMMTFQYQSMDASTTSATIGIQNASRDMGLTIHHNETTPIQSGMAITILRPVEWFSASNWSGRIDPGESEAFVVDVSAIGLPNGHYEKHFTIETSAPNYPLADLVVSMNIQPGELPWGDINQDYQVNLNDAISLVNYVVLIESMSEEQFHRFDLDVNGRVDILDIIVLLESILGIP